MRTPAAPVHGVCKISACAYEGILATASATGDTEGMAERVTPILRVRDHAVAIAWYDRLGFHMTDLHRFEPGFPAFVTVERGPMRLFLSEHTGDARPDTLVYLSVADVRPIAEAFDAPIERAPWGFEVELRDPDRNRLRIGSPLGGNTGGELDARLLPSSKRFARPVVLSALRRGILALTCSIQRRLSDVARGRFGR